MKSSNWLGDWPVWAIVIAGGVSFANGADLLVPEEYATIQAAVNASVDGDRILVAPEVYNETIDLKGRAIHLLAVAGPDMTVIDGTGLPGSILLCDSGEDEDTIIQGFTITGGTGTNFFGQIYGGGLFCKFTDPTIIDCIFVDNDILDVGSTQTSGGAIANFLADPTIIGCRFESNSCQFGDGGGAIAGNVSNPRIMYSMFIGNEAGFAGGAINSVGGAPEILNCVFIGNDAALGGAVRNSDSDASIVNCTFMGNTAQFGAAVRSSSGGEVMISNSVFWDNFPDQVLDIAGSVTTMFNCTVQDGWDGAGAEISTEDPQFIDPIGPDLIPASGDEDLRPRAFSTVIDTGANDMLPPDLIIDIRGANRLVDGDDDLLETVDQGAYEVQSPVPAADVNGDGRVDVLDALEVLAAWGVCPENSDCPADINGDDLVGIIDLLEVLEFWDWSWAEEVSVGGLRDVGDDLPWWFSLETPGSGH